MLVNANGALPFFSALRFATLFQYVCAVGSVFSQLLCPENVYTAKLLFCPHGISNNSGWHLSRVFQKSSFGKAAEFFTVSLQHTLNALLFLQERTCNQIQFSHLFLLYTTPLRLPTICCYGVYGILIGLSNRYWVGKINAPALRPFSEAVPYGVLRSVAANASHSKDGA